MHKFEEKVISQEARDVWNWFVHMKIKSGESLPIHAFNAWCGMTKLLTALEYKPALDELCQLGYLEYREAHEWDYWVA